MDDSMKLFNAKVIKDSGERRKFATGAVRDMAEGKGRCDIMPWSAINPIINYDTFIAMVDCYMDTGDYTSLQRAGEWLISLFPTRYHAMLELSKHFENGLKKYGLDNWKKGIDSSSYCDSMLRHYLKYKAGFDDEPHLTAALWNCVCCLWTIINKPELNSFPVEREDKE